jgi:arylsulfatase A-like enzyme
VRAGDWKLIPGKAKKKAGPAWLLYNLSKDPGESTDIAAENPEKVEELRKLLPTAEAASPFHQ